MNLFENLQLMKEMNENNNLKESIEFNGDKFEKQEFIEYIFSIFEETRDDLSEDEDKEDYYKDQLFNIFNSYVKKYNCTEEEFIKGLINLDDKELTEIGEEIYSTCEEITYADESDYMSDDDEDYDEYDENLKIKKEVNENNIDEFVRQAASLFSNDFTEKDDDEPGYNKVIYGSKIDNEFTDIKQGLKSLGFKKLRGYPDFYNDYYRHSCGIDLMCQPLVKNVAKWNLRKQVSGFQFNYDTSMKINESIDTDEHI